MSKILLVVLCMGFILPLNKLFSQKQNIGISVTPQVGFLLQHRTTMAHLHFGHSYGGQVEVVIQTNGEKQWHHDFKFPTIELNSYYYDLGNRDVLGSVIGVSFNYDLSTCVSLGVVFGRIFGIIMKRFPNK